MFADPFKGNREELSRLHHGCFLGTGKVRVTHDETGGRAEILTKSRRLIRTLVGTLQCPYGIAYCRVCSFSTSGLFKKPVSGQSHEGPS